MAKLTKLTPVLVERTCEYCGDGLLRLKEQCNDGFHMFRSTKYWYEYECKKCGKITKSDRPLRLRDVVFIDEETRKQYGCYNNNGFIIDA
jgi:hypothetical protein